MIPSTTASLDQRGRAALDTLTPDPQQLCARPQVSSSKNAETTETVAALTGSTIGELPQLRAEDIPAIVAHAREVQADWEKTDISERTKLLKAFVDVVLRNREHILDLVQWESAKSRAIASEELTDVCLNALFYANNARRILSPRRVSGAVMLLTKTTVHYRPKGVVGIISPWNYPLTLAISDALPAMAAGNAVVIKPDAHTPHIALALKALLEEAGFPADLYQVAVGRGRELGSPLIANSDYLMFTGSTATGRVVAKQAGEALIGVSAELGGKNPMIIREDANPLQAAKGAVRGCFSNSGQLCMSIERIYVHHKIWDRFVRAFVAETAKIRVAATYDWNSTMGPLISQQQFDTVREHIDDAVAKGARVLHGGQALPDVSPHAYAPTILTDVPSSAILYREETFGPVVSLYPVANDEEAIRLANDTDYGLNAAVFTGNLAAGEAVARRVAAGSVNVNEGYTAAFASTAAPSGGIKASGLSSRHGEEGILKYCDAHVTAVQRLLPIAPLPLMSQQLFGGLMTLYMRLKRYVPFL